MQSIRRTCSLDIAVVAVLALVARLPWALIVHRGASSDSLFYVLGAKSIAAGHGYQILHHPTAFFPVGWPAFLAGLFLITGPSFAVVKVAALVLWMLTTAFVYLIGRRLGGRSVGLVAGGLVAVAPTMTIYAMRASSEHLFIPLLLAVCLLVVTADGRTPSIRRAALAGVFLGLAILVRSTGILLPLVIPLWLLLRRPARESWRAAVTMSVVSVLVLTPWMARSAVVMHTLGLSTNGGYTIWMGAHPGANGGFDNGGKPWAIRSVSSEMHQNSLLLRESVHYVVHNPLDWLGLIPAKFEHLMIWDPGPLQVAHSRHLHGSAATLINGSFHYQWLFELWHYSYWVLGGLALVLTTRRRLPGAGLAALLVGFWIVFHVTLVHGESRYMLSVTPLVAPALAWLLVAGARRVMALAERVRADQA